MFVHKNLTMMGVGVVKKSVYLLFVFLLLTICGCADDQEKKLVGTWQETSNPLGVLIFRKDHTGRAFWPNEAGKQESDEMKWVLLKGENKVSVITSPGPVNFDIKEDSLVSPNGVVLKKMK